MSEIEILQNKVRKYEEFLHAINAAVVTCNHAQLQHLIDNAFKWSYAGRVGNGELTVEEQNLLVQQALERLTD